MWARSRAACHLGLAAGHLWRTPSTPSRPPTPPPASNPQRPPLYARLQLLEGFESPWPPPFEGSPTTRSKPPGHRRSKPPARRASSPWHTTTAGHHPLYLAIRVTRTPLQGEFFFVFLVLISKPDLFVCLVDFILKIGLIYYYNISSVHTCTCQYVQKWIQLVCVGQYIFFK
jgi:hypothetical protein